MLSREENGFVMIKIESGENVLETLEKACKIHNISSGAVQWGIGMFKEIDIGFFNGKEYVREDFPKAAEIVSLHGSIANTEPRFHIHTSFASEDHIVRGGHLFRAIANPLVEIEIQKFSSLKIERKLNTSSGLKEIEIL